MTFEIQAQSRAAQGTGASRRLRRAGQLPGIVYGGDKAPQAITLDHNSMYYTLQDEAFHTALVKLNIDGAAAEQVLVRAVQYHPFKQQVLHIDFQRVSAKQKITMKIPLHYSGEEESTAVKTDKCLVNHILTELEVSCLPADLPEAIKVDLSKLEKGSTLTLKDIELPKGVEPMLHGHSAEDTVLVSVVMPAAEEPEADAAAGDAAPAAEGDKK